MKLSKIVPIRHSWLVQNCLMLVILLGCSLEAKDLQEKPVQLDSVEVFRSDLKKYKPNAPWITESFMDMNLMQFSNAFKHTVKILTVPQRRWFYFSDSSTNFEQDNYWAESLWQCIHYEQWMSKLSLDKDQLVYKDAQHTKIPYIKILTNIEQSKLGKNLVNKYYQFYAFFIDCLSNFFCKAVYECYSSLDDPNTYKFSLDLAKKCLSKMKLNLQIIKKSKFFYPSYKMTLDSYKNILALLQAEKVKTQLEVMDG